jgi:SpoIID/LytB domain protein
MILENIFGISGTVNNIALKKNPFGYISSIVITSDKDHEIPVVQFRSRLEKAGFFGINGSLFTARLLPGGIYFEGKGFGHHTGMCQWGARNLAAHGFLFGKILKFYYPGIELISINGSRGDFN